MKRKNKYLLIPLLSFLCLNNVYASCTQEEIDNFKKIQDEFTVTYEFDTESKTYTLFFNNPEPKKYGYILTYYENNNTETEINFSSNELVEFKYPKLSAGNYEILIIGVTSNCTDKLKSINLDLSKYNSYSEDPLCEGIEEFVLCQSTYDKEIDYETFKSRVETYKKSKSSKENIENKQDDVSENKKTNEIAKYIEENITNIIIIIIFIVLVITTIVISLKSLKKRRRLE